jgi:hypothetical protein
MLRDWPTEWPLERIAAFAQTSFVAYLVASEPVRLTLLSGGSEPMQTRTIIDVGGYT